VSEGWGRRTGPVSAERIDAVHARLGEVRVTLSPDPAIDELRESFAEIRGHRNVVSRILAKLLPLLARLRADQIRLDRTCSREGAAIVDSGEGLLGCTNDKLRTARVKLLLSDDYDALAEVRADLALVEEAVSHAKLAREELRFAFEEASRALASIELEWRVERSAP